MKKLKDKVLMALWFPLLWVALLAADIVLFSDGRAKGLMPRLFEDLVFVLSFFFFRTSNIRGDWRNIVIPFFVQFFLWWTLSFVIILAIAKTRAKKTTATRPE